MGYHVLDDELKKLVQQVCRQFMNSFQPRPKRGRRVRRGGGAGGATTNLTAFAVAVSSDHAVLLNELMQPLDANGNPLIIDENESGFDQSKLDAVKIPVQSAHTDSTIKRDDRLRLFATQPIEPGAAADPDHPVWALHVDGSSYWEGHPSFGAKKVLGAAGGNAVYRMLPTGSPDAAGSGAGSCNSQGGVDISIDIAVTGGPFVVQFED